jgi:hypothetical protein
MTVIHLPPRLTVMHPDARPEPVVSIAHAEGRLRSAIGHMSEASARALDAALGNGDREDAFDGATVALENALLDFLTLTSHGGSDMALRQMLRARKAEREQAL